MKRVFIIVLDSFGIGALPDAANYGDQGSDTLAACFASGKLFVPQMQHIRVADDSCFLSLICTFITVTVIHIFVIERYAQGYNSNNAALPPRRRGRPARR